MYAHKAVISGYGFVGKATELTLKKFASSPIEIQINDPKLNNEVSWKHVLNHFISVPTPSTDSGYILDYIFDAIDIAARNDFVGRTFIRSTISLSDIEKINDRLQSQFTQWPEFLREATWEDDALNPSLTIFAGWDSAHLTTLMPDLSAIVANTPEYAVLAKTSINSILATKTIIANDLLQLCQTNNLDYTKLQNMISCDQRIGPSHLSQPGPDGKYGFGGSCFPKDVKAMVAEMQVANIQNSFVEWTNNKNKLLR